MKNTQNKKYFFNSKIAIFALAFVTASLGFAKVLDVIAPYLGDANLNVSHYHVKVDINEWPPQKVNFISTLTLSSKVALQDVELHIEKSVLTVNKVEFEGQELSFQILNGIANAHGLTGSVLFAQLPRTVVANSAIQISIHYTVQKPDWSDDKGLFFVAADKNYGQDLLITRNWPYYGRYWLPSHDTPDDVSTVSYEIKAPPSYLAVANGELINKDKATNTYYWAQKTPTTTYNFAFAVARFNVLEKNVCFNRTGRVDNKRVNCAFAQEKVPAFLYYNKNHPNAAAFLQQTSKALDSLVYFSKLLGPYEFEKIGFIHSPYPFAMESTSLIVLDQPSSAVHEVVHHWWGNNVHIEHWGDFWISEGFTTYFTGLYDEYLSGTNTSCLSADKAVLNHGPLTDPNDIFDSTPYCKGAFALYSLRVRIARLAGTHKNSKNVFLLLMRDLYKKYASQKLSTVDVVEHARVHLQSIYRSQKIEVTQEQVNQLIESWKKAWFVGV